MAQPNTRYRKPKPSAILAAVIFTTISSAVVYGLLLSSAKEHYRLENKIQDQVLSTIFGGRYTRPAPVSIGMIGWQDLSLRVILPTMCFALLYPVIGRFVAQIATETTKGVNQVYELKEEAIKWNPDGQLLYGAAWPITIFTLALLILALVIGYIYRSLWD